MNVMKINEVFGEIPEGFLMEKRRMRVTAILGLATSVVLPLPAAEVAGDELRTFFNTSFEAVHDLMYKINEVVPFDVDRATEYAFQIWKRRYDLVFNPNPHCLFGTDAFGGTLYSVVPELDELCVGADPVINAVRFLKEALSA